jgi:hypothetical protein
MRAAQGSSSRSRPSRFAVNSELKKLIPVRLPPGRARLATRPPDRVLGGNKGDRDRRGCRLDSDGRDGCARGDYSDPSVNQFGRQFRQSIVLVLGETVDDCYVLALHIADFLETKAEFVQTVRHRARRSGIRQPNHRQRALLPAHHDRPNGDRSCNCFDEIASSHCLP